MNEAQRFNEWLKAHYPSASRVHKSMMYAAWNAALAPAAKPPAPKTAKKPKPKSKPLGMPGDE